jgi:hypothetical protein
MNAETLAVNNLKTYFLVSAIANAVAIVVGGISVLLTGLATCGIGCVFIFLPLINTTVMVFDIIAYSKASEPPSPEIYSFLRMAAILDLLACFFLVPLVMGILNLQILGRPEIYAYFHGTAQNDGA